MSTTYRRVLLDELLSKHSPLIQGRVIDLGGKRNRTRGGFKKPEDGIEQWLTINIDPHAQPDILADIRKVPLQNSSADCVICTEVLQYLLDPQDAVKEIYRLLKTKGLFIGCTPLLYRVHSRFPDLVRYTSAGLKELFSSFSSVELTPMGGLVGSIGLLIELEGNHRSYETGQRLSGAILQSIGRMIWKIERLIARGHRTSNEQGSTTGYFIVARK